MTDNLHEQFNLSDVAAGTYPVSTGHGSVGLRGGYYWIETLSTGTGTIDLKKLGPDGATYTARMTQITATAGQQTLYLPPGVYEIVIATFTANYVTIQRIPLAAEDQ
jgi:hypothetical protein